MKKVFIYLYYRTLRNITLYKHQEKGLDFLLNKGSGMLAFDVGAGKTMTALLAAEKWGGVTLVACPAYLVGNWVKEYQDVVGKTPYVVIEKGLLQKGDCQVIVGSYSMLQKRYVMNKLPPQNITTLIVDESQAIKEGKSKRTRFILKYKNIPHRILLSATPMVNRPIELFSQLQMINPKVYSNRVEFVNAYCVKHPYFHYIIKDKGKNLELLAKNLELEAMRVRSEDINDMPELIRKHIVVDLFKDQNKEAKEIVAIINKEGMKKALKRLVDYRKKLEMHKAKWFVKSYKSDKDLWEGKKILIGVQFRATARFLSEQIKSGIYISGEIEAKERVRIIQEDFKNSDDQFIFATIASVAEGLNLAWIDEVQILGLGWTPSQHQQFEGRLRRITRKGRVVSTYYICPQTVDEFIMEKLELKKKMIDQVIEGKPMEEIVNSMQSDYIKLLKEKK